MEADKTLSRTLLTLGISLLAGVCGAVLAYAYFLPEQTAFSEAERIVLPVQVSTPKQAPKIPAVTLAVVPHKALKEVPGGYAVADGDIVGYATALTSDGWLATDKEVLSGVVDPVVILPGGNFAAASGTMADVATGIEFLHVEARNLGVIAFGDSAGLASGATMFRVFPDSRLSPVGLVSAHARIRAEAADAIRQSSEPSDRLLFTGGIPKERAGSGIVTESGALVGIALAPGKGETESAVGVPIESVALALREILRSGEARRPDLGMSTVDLSELAWRDTGLVKAYGATVATIVPGGPAAIAGIEVGDRVTAIGADVLDGSRLLSDLLAKYSVGEKVRLTYVRDGEQGSAEIVVADASPAVPTSASKK